jgi:hypothetical protein
VAKGVAYYRGVRGSASLHTERLAPGAVAAEAIEPGQMRRVPFAGELLGAARVRGGYAAIPLEAFDRLGEVLEAEAQAAYLQLLRLSYGEGRNWARAGKKELMARLRLSERRLLRVLDRLVEQGFARPLHRDNRGTLWRVALPREAFGEPLGDDVLLGRATPAPVGAAPPDGVAGKVRARLERLPAALAAPPPTSTPTGARASTTALARASPKLCELARALCAARGLAGDEPLATALREVRELLEEGQAPRRIAAAIEATARRTASRSPRAHPGLPAAQAQAGSSQADPGRDGGVT